MNNTERNQWIDNDEGLYNWWRSTKLSKSKFIQQYKSEIDQAINNVVGGNKPAHYLEYGTPTRLYDYNPPRCNNCMKQHYAYERCK